MSEGALLYLSGDCAECMELLEHAASLQVPFLSSLVELDGLGDGCHLVSIGAVSSSPLSGLRGSLDLLTQFAERRIAPTA